MQRVHKLAPAPGLEMPVGFDPSGIPCLDTVHSNTPEARPHRRRSRSLPGLSPTTLIASVEDVALKCGGDWLIWGSVGGRPVLFTVEAGAAAEMMDTVTAGETATAIIEPWQLVLERLD